MSERGDLTTESKRAMQEEGRFAMTGVEYRERLRAESEALRAHVESLRPGTVNLRYHGETVEQVAPTGRVHPRYAELHAKMRAICEAKNSDYADSDTDPLLNFRGCEDFDIPAFDGALVRMSDKWKRITNLRRKERESRGVAVKDESITDTLLDLANYCLIAIVLHEEMRARPVQLSFEEMVADPAIVKAAVDRAIREGVESGRIEPVVLESWERSQG